MKTQIARLQCGELYLFNPDDPRCDPATSLWGIFDDGRNGQVRLETASVDLRHFRLNTPLPATYRYCRLASREELRDFAYCLGFARR